MAAKRPSLSTCGRTWCGGCLYGQSGSRCNRLWLAYFIVSVTALFALYLDPHFNQPSGLISLDLFTERPVRHGFDPCSWDYDGSWKIGGFTGPSPTNLSVSAEALITCATVNTTSASYVTAPFVHIPSEDGAVGRGVWTAFYEMRDLDSFSGVIGVAVSRDAGATWRHLGTALQERRQSLSSPFVVYDPASRLYIMLPDVRPVPSWMGTGPARMEAYTTTTEEFPFGWKLARHEHFGPGSAPDPSEHARGPVVQPGQSNRRLGSDNDGAASSDRLLHSHSAHGFTGLPPLPRGQHLRRAVAVQHEGRWWIFATHVQSRALPWQPPVHKQRVYTADGKGGLLSAPWELHPASQLPPPHQQAPVQPSAGRPFVWRGALHRWVQPCGAPGSNPACEEGRGGAELTLLRATAANATHFAEEPVASYRAPGDRSWFARRLGHADVRPLPAEGGKGGERWWGLVSGDRYADGMHHFLVHESWFVELKAHIRQLMGAQLALVVTALVLQAWVARCAEGGPRRASGGGGAVDDEGKDGYTSGGSGGGGGGRGSGAGGAAGSGNAVRRLELVLRRSPLAAAVLDTSGRLLHTAAVGITAGCAAIGGVARRIAGQPRVQLAAIAVATCLGGYAIALAVMLLQPSAVPCPRWPVVVRPFAGSPHYVPPQPFVDPAGPYDVSNLTVVTGGTQSFFDRVENLVGSLQYWEPRQRLVVYDLGFTSKQLAAMRCWRGVSVERFPYEQFPPHVREASTYAWKPVAFAYALKKYPVMLWIDAGLEVRASLDSMRATLARHGHVTGQQSDAPSINPYSEKYVAPFLNIPPAEWERIKDLPYCAGGLQGYVAGGAAERLILGPSVDCSLDELNCIAPPGHKRGLTMYDQTALTLQLRRYNFSSCMPRETHCTSAVKKVSWDPAASSDPIVIASRRHRWPKPYRSRVQSLPGCVPDPATNPWRSVSSEHPETVTKSSSLLFRVGFVYGQALGDFLIQAGCCLGFHFLASSILAAGILAAEGCRYWMLRNTAGSAQHTSGVAAWGGWLVLRVQQLLAGLGIMLLLSPLALMTACRAV